MVKPPACPGTSSEEEGELSDILEIEEYAMENPLRETQMPQGNNYLIPRGHHTTVTSLNELPPGFRESLGKSPQLLGASPYSQQHSYSELLENDPFLPDSEKTPLLKYIPKKSYVSPGSMLPEIQNISSPESTKMVGKRKALIWKWLNNLKIFVLFLIIFIFTLLYALYPDIKFDWKQLSLSRFEKSDLIMDDVSTDNPILKVYLKGCFLDSFPSINTNNLTVKVTNPITNHSKFWILAIANIQERYQIPETIVSKKFDFSQEVVGTTFEISLKTTAYYSVPLSISFLDMPRSYNNSVLFASIIIVFVYVLIIFELVHRAVAAMLGSLMTIAVLALVNEKPSLDMVVTWLDYNTLSLLFGMMVLVAILSDTGFFDYVALMAYKLAKSKTWPLITILCACSLVMSAFLDNVTTILLLSPITIRLCEVLNLDPKHVLMAEVMFANIGGTATAIGDPPNVIVLSNAEVVEQGIDFGIFTLHMSIGSFFCAIGAYALLRLMYRRKELLKSSDPPHVAEMKREVEIWRRTCMKMVVATREESTVKALLLEKICRLENSVRIALYEHNKRAKTDDFKIQYSELAKIYRIRDKPLLIKCIVVLTVVIVGFFVNSFVSQLYLSVGWIPLLGAMWLLILSDFKDIDGILQRLEWATLLFFAALFVLMEGISQLGLIAFITEKVIEMIQSINEESRLAVAIIIILWIAALVSSFIDNIPFTTAMLPVIVQLSQDKDVNLPLQPLIWSLAFGACLGGNGTLIGASCNVVAAGIADAHGHGFTFGGFFKVGFPMMLWTTFIAMVYLLICHVAIGWNG